MLALEAALELDSGISEDKANLMAKNLLHLNSDAVRIAQGLNNIGEHRTSGVGYSEEVSDLISRWIEKHFDEQMENNDVLIDVIYELTSKNSDKMTLRLLNNSTCQRVQSCLLDALSYKGS